jgi:glutaminyl-peptide cyclotransferase
MIIRTQADAISVFVIASSMLVAGAFPLANAEQNAAPLLAYRVVATHPHSTEIFTQGFAFAGEELIESGGRYAHSSICRLDRASGRALGCVRLPNEVFGEGLAVVGEKIFQLTWREQVGFIYDRKLNRTGEFRYDGEGWGLAYDGKHLLMSDGSPALRELDAGSLQERRRIPIMDAGRPLDLINELEYADRHLWANIWLSDRVAVIDVARGRVAAWLDLSGLRLRFSPPPGWDARENVLNGIAHDPRSGHFFVTGKRWPLMFEIEVQRIPK